jgi:hypothetical protein
VSSDEGISACTIVLILSSSTVFSVQSGAFFCVSGVVCFLYGGVMRGVDSSSSIVVSIGATDAEGTRLQELADRAGSSSDMVRDQDMVLFDYLDGDHTSDVLSSGLRGSEISMPPGLETFKRDCSDYGKFGGDVVSMELDRSDVEMDDLLGFTMDSSPSPESGDVVSDAMVALEEHFGSNVMAVLESDSSGIVVFSVDSPRFGRVKYSYDSHTGEGRVMRGE